MSMQIRVSHGKFAIVDDEDFERLNIYIWHLDRSAYAARNEVKPDGSGMYVQSMHREIMGLGHDDGHIVDHINGDGLDNRRCNLRICTIAENIRNRTRLNKNNTSGMRGVHWDKRKEKWCAEIKVNRKKKFLGRFSTREEAHAAYCKAADEFHGEFANYSASKVAPEFDLSRVKGLEKTG
jgi:hypothetical protein